jgi:branched-chain amino acid transport system permease protein
MLIVQIIVNGLLLGGLYTCMAVGFSLVWGVMNLINVSHGSLIMLGAYVSFWLFYLFHIDPFASVPISAVALFAFGYLIQRYLFNLVVKAPLFVTLLITFGFNLLLINVALLLWSADFRSANVAYSGSRLELGPIIVPYVRLWTAIVGMVCTALLHLLLTRTRIGIAIRATRMNLDASQVCGVKVGRIYAITFGLGAAMAGVAGSLMATTYALTPIMGLALIGKVFVVCVVGGLGNIEGALFGAMALGVTETLGSAYLGGDYQELIGYVLLIVVLTLRPSGLVGKRYYEI